MQLAQVTNKTEIKGPPTSAGGPSLTVYYYSPFRSARCGAPGGTLLGSLWGWAILHKAVTAIEIDMLYALIAAAHRKRCLRSVRPGRVTG